MDKQDYWKNKENREIERQNAVSKHGSMNTAVEILKMTGGYTNKAPIDVLGEAKTLAEEIFNWVNKK